MKTSKPCRNQRSGPAGLASSYRIKPFLGESDLQGRGCGIEIEFEMRDSGPVLVRKPAMNFIDDKAGKPVGIHRHIGRRPIAAFGNSDGSG
jgi:hypothetical protein